ncbi:hypothetical protein JCM30760_26770 [Thiomicrorhabdus hydrogeniphila]
MLRVLSVYNLYEKVDKTFKKPVNFMSLNELKKGLNKYLPDFLTNPDLKEFEFKIQNFFINESFSNYEFINMDTGEVTEQRLVQIYIDIEIDNPDFTIGDGHYRLRIDVACNDPQQIQEIESSIYIPQTSASQAMTELTMVKKYNSIHTPQFI